MNDECQFEDEWLCVVSLMDLWPVTSVPCFFPHIVAPGVTSSLQLQNMETLDILAKF